MKCTICEETIAKSIYPYAKYTYSGLCDYCIENRIRLEVEHEKITKGKKNNGKLFRRNQAEMRYDG